LSVSDTVMQEMVQYAARREGILTALESAATIAAYHRLLASGFLQPGDEVVAFFTGSGLPDVLSNVG